MAASGTISRGRCVSAKHEACRESNEDHRPPSLSSARWVCLRLWHNGHVGADIDADMDSIAEEISYLVGDHRVVASSILRVLERRFDELSMPTAGALLGMIRQRLEAKEHP